jgi:fibronectin type 3 domain-containing protein
VPAAPSGLAAKIAGSSVLLTWTNNATTPAATAIVIQRATDAGFTKNRTDTTVRPAATSYTDKKVRAGTTYYYRVQAQNRYGNSPWSNVTSIRILRGASLSRNLTATADAPGTPAARVPLIWA